MSLRVLVVVVALLSAACATVSVPAPGPGPVNHLVLCWLKEPGNLQQRQALISASYDLASIQGVVSIAAGTVLRSSRPVVDDTFDVAILFTFESERDLQRYLEHPAHLHAVKTALQPLVARHVAYDFFVDRS